MESTAMPPHADTAPPSERVLIMVNAGAGRRRAAAAAAVRLAAALRARRIPVETVAGRSVTEARAAIAAGARRGGGFALVAVGGDGTVAAAVDALDAASGGGPLGPLGILPAGSGNDFASAVGADGDAERLAAALAAGRTRALDVGRIRWSGPEGAGTRCFVGGAGLGLEARAVALARRLRGLPGALRYRGAGALAALAALRPTDFTLDATPAALGAGAGRMTLLHVGNTARAGGGIVFCPAARPDDGRLDVVSALVPSRRLLFRLLARASRGRLDAHPCLERFRASALTLVFARGVALHADGEPLAGNVRRVEISVEPARLRIGGAFVSE